MGAYSEVIKAVRQPAPTSLTQRRIQRPKENRVTRIVKLGIVACALLASTLLTGRSALADSGFTTCSANLTIFTTSAGTVTAAGQTTHIENTGVGGMYTGGFLAGYTISGAQDIAINNAINAAQLHGIFVATGSGGTLTLRYNGHADLNAGAAEGDFVTAGGTGQFASFHWTGTVTAQLISLAPPTFLAVDSGPCHSAP
jgi:hypothetical protein